MISCNIKEASIGRHTVLQDIHFSANDRKIMCLLGKNGSGKTSLLRCLAGLLPYQGVVHYEHASTDPYSILNQSFSYMPQSCSPIRLTVEQMLSFTRCPNQGLFQSICPEDKQVIENILDQLDLLKFRNKLVCHLSGGERQLVYFASLLAQDKQHLLMDEPCANLDPEKKTTIFRYLEEERGKGKSIILSLHQLEDAFRIADEILLLSSGKIIFSGSPAQLIASDLIQNEFSMTPCVVSDSGKQYTLFYQK